MFHPAAVNNVGHYFLRFGNKAYFPGSNPASNTEMWKTDGTELGTVQVSEIEIAINPFIPEYPKRRVVLKDKIYYLGGNQELGSQIFVIDPITDKTELLIDLKDKINGQVYFQTDLVANEKHIFLLLEMRLIVNCGIAMVQKLEHLKLKFQPMENLRLKG